MEGACTTWHHIRQRYRTMFLPDALEVVERWYNTIAPPKDRASFRDVIKAIRRAEPHDVEDPVARHRCRHIVNLYTKLLSLDAQQRALWWVTNAQPEDLDRFRDVFAAVEATLVPKSTMKRDFIPHPLTLQSKGLRRPQLAPIPESGSTQTAPTPSLSPRDRQRLKEEAKQRDCNTMMRNLGLADGNDVRAMKQRRERVRYAETLSYDPSGCSNYRSRGATRSFRDNSRLSRVVPTTEEDAVGWCSTSKEMYRNYGTGSGATAVHDHASRTKYTASLGMVVPSLA